MGLPSAPGSNHEWSPALDNPWDRLAFYKTSLTSLPVDAQASRRSGVLSKPWHDFPSQQSREVPRGKFVAVGGVAVLRDSYSSWHVYARGETRSALL